MKRGDLLTVEKKNLAFLSVLIVFILTLGILPMVSSVGAYYPTYDKIESYLRDRTQYPVVDWNYRDAANKLRRTFVGEQGTSQVISYVDSNTGGYPFEPLTNPCPSIQTAPYWVQQPGVCIGKDSVSYDYSADQGCEGLTESVCRDDPSCIWSNYDCGTCVDDRDCESGYTCNIYNGMCELATIQSASCTCSGFYGSTTFGCQGTAIGNSPTSLYYMYEGEPCDGFTASVCDEVHGCYWTALSTQQSCSTLTTQSTCSAQTGCTWSCSNPVYSWSCPSGQEKINYCLGTEACHGLSDSACSSTPGCVLYHSCRPEKRDYCEPCSTDNDCKSGICKYVITPDAQSESEILGYKMCAESSTCGASFASSINSIDGQSCLVDYFGSGDEICSSENNRNYMCINGLWNPDVVCQYGCNESTWRCNTAPTTPTMSISWKDRDGIFSYDSTSPTSPLVISVNSILKIYINNTCSYTGSLSVWEEDTTNPSDIVRSIDPTSVSAPVVSNGVLIFEFKMTKELMDNILETDEGDVLEFVAEYDDDACGKIATSKTLYTSIPTQAVGCGDGVCDIEGGESYETCPTDCPNELTCGNGVCDTDESLLNCWRDCAPTTKEAVWYTPSYSEVTYGLSLFTEGEGLLAIMRLANPDGTNPEDFTLYENDLIGKDVNRIVSSSYNADEGVPYLQATTYITLDDLIQADESSQVYDFMFSVDGKTSSVMKLTVSAGEVPVCGNSVCEPGETQSNCESDCFCNAEVVLCSGYTTENACRTCGTSLDLPAGTSCIWNPLAGTSGECQSRKVETYNGIEIGSCLYSEDAGEDTCEDGYLSFSWTGLWEWAVGAYDEIPAEADPQDYVLGSDLKYHYDPQRQSEACGPGQSTLPCPAKAKLDFFTWKNLVAAVILVIVVYVIISKRRKASRKKKSEAKKKISKKTPVKKAAIKKKTVAKKVVAKKVSKKKSTKRR